MSKKDYGFHCSVHGAIGQGLKNGRCELCWPPQPITTVAQVIDLLEVEVAKCEEMGYMGAAEDRRKILDYILVGKKREKEELNCEKCYREYPIWFTDNAKWNLVMRKPDGSDVFSFLCMDCFALAYEEKVGEKIIWKVFKTKK